MKPGIRLVTLHFLACTLAVAGLLGSAAPAADGAGPLPSGSAKLALTLEAAIDLALANNPELHAAGGHVDAASGRAYQAKLWPNPELTLSAEEWPMSGDGSFADAKQTLGLAQTLPFPGKKKLDRQIGASGVRRSEADLALHRIHLVRDVKAAFYTVLAAEGLVEVAGQLVRVAESSAATARKRVAAGAAADQEQLRAEIPLEQAAVELSGFERELVAARQNLALLLGRLDLATTPVSGLLAETADLALLDRGPKQWLDNHPQVRAVKTRRDQANLELKRARLEPYPDVRLGVAGGRLGDTGQSILELGLSVPLPILDWSKGRKEEARAHVRIAAAEQAAVEQGLMRDWGIASKRFRTAVEQVTHYRERILPKAEEALRLVQTGFEQGRFGFMDLLDTQRTAAETRLAYQHKLLELNIARVELEALTGGAP